MLTKKWKIPSVSEDMEKLELLYIADRKKK
jgi:hypothetical protein